MRPCFVFGRPVWPPGKIVLAGKTPLAEIRSITTDKAWFGQAIDIGLVDGGHWRYEVNRWKPLEKALPAHLLVNSS